MSDLDKVTESVSSMQRVLAVVVSLVLVIAAAVTPAFACIRSGASLDPSRMNVAMAVSASVGPADYHCQCSARLRSLGRSRCY
jgi:hypothetical protein